jgi:hypothetical protein
MGVIRTPATKALALLFHGGSMASRVAQATEVTTAAIYISNAVAFTPMGAVIPPVALIPGANDPGHALGSNTGLYNAHNGTVDMLLSKNSAEPITPGLFKRIPGINCALSLSIRDAFVDSNIVDDGDSMLAIDPKADMSRKDAIPTDASMYELVLFDVLIEAYAGHSPSSDKNSLVFDFLDAHLN